MPVRRTSIVYACHGTCTASVRTKKVKRNTEISLVADGTTVTLTFATSPFVSGQTTITIPTDTIAREKFVNRTGKFDYQLSCTGCPTANDDFIFIVEL